MSTIRNLVFSGGGVRGGAYAGFFREAQDRNFYFDKVERVAGTSAGALMAAFVALNYSVDEIEKIYWALDFNEFKDPSFGVLGKIEDLTHEFGIYKGDVLHDFSQNIVAGKTGDKRTTFAELKAMQKDKHYKDLYIVGTKIFYIHGMPSFETVIFSHETTPHTPIADAVRASMTIPLFFAALRFHQLKDGSYIQNTEKGHVFVDGGITNNYAIRVFDHANYRGGEDNKVEFNAETLGLSLKDASQIAQIEAKDLKYSKPIKNFEQYLTGVISTLMSAQNENFKDSRDLERTVLIDCTGIKSTDFDLTLAKKKILMERGKKAAAEFITRQKVVMFPPVEKSSTPESPPTFSKKCTLL